MMKPDLCMLSDLTLELPGSCTESRKKCPYPKQESWAKWPPKLHAPKLLEENMLWQTMLDFRARGLAKRPAEVLSRKSHALMKRLGNIRRLTLSLPEEFLREQLGMGVTTLSDLFWPSGPTDHITAPEVQTWLRLWSHQRKVFFF